MRLHERRGRPDRVVMRLVVRTWMPESPSLSLVADVDLVVAGFDPGSGKNPAVVRTARPRPVLVDRAGVVDQHRAMTLFVVSEHDMTAGQPRRWNQQVGIDVRQRVGFVGPDVNELRRSAARRAAPARNVGGRLTGNSRLPFLKPRREMPRGQRCRGGHAEILHGYRAPGTS